MGDPTFSNHIGEIGPSTLNGETHPAPLQKLQSEKEEETNLVHLKLGDGYLSLRGLLVTEEPHPSPHIGGELLLPI